MVFSTPLVTADLIFSNDVLIPLLFFCAKSANPPTPSFNSINLSLNSVKVMSPFFKASYKAFVEVTPLSSNDLATLSIAIGIVSCTDLNDCISTSPRPSICRYCSIPRLAASEEAPLAKKALFNAIAVSAPLSKLPVEMANCCVLATISSNLVGKPSIPSVSFCIDLSTSCVE